MLWKVWLLVESDQGTNGPTKGQGHLLSCSGQLKTTCRWVDPPTYLPPLENTLKEWSFTVVFLVMVGIICLHTFTFTKETMYFVTSPVIVHLTFTFTTNTMLFSSHRTSPNHKHLCDVKNQNFTFIRNSCDVSRRVAILVSCKSSMKKVPTKLYSCKGWVGAVWS